MGGGKFITDEGEGGEGGVARNGYTLRRPTFVNSVLGPVKRGYFIRVSSGGTRK